MCLIISLAFSPFNMTGCIDTNYINSVRRLHILYNFLTRSPPLAFENFIPLFLFFLENSPRAQSRGYQTGKPQLSRLSALAIA